MLHKHLGPKTGRGINFQDYAYTKVFLTSLSVSIPTTMAETAQGTVRAT